MHQAVAASVDQRPGTSPGQGRQFVTAAADPEPEERGKFLTA